MGTRRFARTLPLMYFVDFDSAIGELTALEIILLRMRRLRLVHASSSDAEWLAHKLDEVSRLRYSHHAR